MTNKEILKRLYKDYTKKYVSKILLSVFFTVLLAGSTSAVAYLLDPAIEKLFIYFLLISRVQLKSNEIGVLCLIKKFSMLC